MESKKKQIRYEFFYLINFKILTPIITYKLNNKTQVFYHQSILINNIDFTQYQENEEEDPNEMDKSKNEDEEEEEKLDEDINSQIKTFLYRDDKRNEKEQKKFLEIFKKNTYHNNPDIEKELSYRFKINFESLLMALDSVYLVPYNSETLKICFHYYGINLCYLGKIAERSTIPHIRELCLNLKGL